MPIRDETKRLFNPTITVVIQTVASSKACTSIPVEYINAWGTIRKIKTSTVATILNKEAWKNRREFLLWLPTEIRRGTMTIFQRLPQTA